MFHHVTEVKPIADYALLVRFADGIEKQYDVKPLFNEIVAFQPLAYVTVKSPMFNSATGAIFYVNRR